MPRYIRTNTLKLSFREDMRIGRTWKGVVLLLLRKLFRQRLKSGLGTQVPVPIQDFIIPEDKVPPPAAERMSAPLKDLERWGFTPPVYNVTQSLGGESITVTANSRHTDGEIWSRITYARLGTVHPPTEVITSYFVSQLQDGRRLVCSARRRHFDSPPNVIVHRVLGASAETLLAMHQKKLGEIRSSSPPQFIADDAAMLKQIDRSESESLEFHLRRGVYEEISPEEILIEQARQQARDQLPGLDGTDRAILADIARLQERQEAWKSASLIALITFVAFLALGRMRWSWEFVLILTGVVAFHEAGHYIAMRLFHYKDVRMFFVPLVGAAVTGRHYNIKGWQRAIVSLAGPVPGILAGLAVLGMAHWTHSPLAERVAQIALAVNGLNLLPLLPLDGGWIVHALVFSRHYILETIFMGLAGIALVVATALGLGSLWMYLGILILIGLPATYRLSVLTRQLRSSDIPKISPDGQVIPPATALEIIRHLKGKAKGARLTRHLASQTLDIFQRLNAIPPTLAASTLLLALYLGTAAGAWYGVRAVRAFQSEILTERINENFPQPTMAVNPDGIRLVQPGSNSNLWLTPVVLATFTNATEAAAQLQAVTEKAAPDNRLLLMGQSMFLAGPHVTSNWPGWFKQRHADVIIEYPRSNLAAMVSLCCRAPEEKSATAIKKNCQTYFSGIWLNLWPPWVSLEGHNPALVQRIETTRHTFACLNDLEKTVAKDPELHRMINPFGFFKHKTDAEMKESLQKQVALERTIFHREIDRLLNSNDAQLDKEMVKLYGRMHFDGTTNNEQASERFRQSFIDGPASLPFKDGMPQSEEAWSAATVGNIEQAGAQLNFNFLVFQRTDSGLPALIGYLHQKGCDNFRYGLKGFEDGGGNDNSIDDSEPASTKRN